MTDCKILTLLTDCSFWGYGVWVMVYGVRLFTQFGTDSIQHSGQLFVIREKSSNFAA